MADEPKQPQPGNTSPAAGTEDATTKAAAAKPVDALTLKLEGDNIPAELRGKSVADLLKLHTDTHGALTKEQQKTAQWESYYRDQEAKRASAAIDPNAEPEQPPFDEKQLKIMQGMLDTYMAPVLGFISSASLDNAKSLHPDFSTYEAKAKEFYDKMPLTAKFHPDYGWNFAYNLAKAESEGVGARKAPAPVGGSGPAPAAAKEPALSDDDLLWAKRMNMTPEEFIAFSTPKEA